MMRGHLFRRAPAFALVTALLVGGLWVGWPAEASDCASDQLCVGAASVDMTWHTGSGQGQHGTAGNQLTADHFDPFHHSTKMVPTGGIQSRTFSKAIVVQGPGPDGGGRTKVAYAKTELYLQQDLLTRRVGQLVSGTDPVTRDYVVPGLQAANVMLGGTHNHSAPYYASTAFGVWVFTDTFDFRMFELTARKIAASIKQADDALQPARVGASVIEFDEVQRNIVGPKDKTWDGSPAGFPRDYFDKELSVIRFDAAETHEPIAALVNLGMHPESMDGVDLISADFVGLTERMVERALGRSPGATDGPVVAWSQGSVGDVEPNQDDQAQPFSKKRVYWHRNTAQMERMSSHIAAAVLEGWEDVERGTAGVAAKHIPPTTNAPLAMTDHRFAGPLSHPLPTVSNCRTDHPGVPIAGVPDCFHDLGDAPEQFGTTVNTLQDAGIPVPDQYGAPSAGGVQESTTIHLQALRIGEILLASCPCEPQSDMTLNFKSRADRTTGNLFNGFNWPCTDTGGPTVTCDFRSAPHAPPRDLAVDRDAYELMRAQVNNDAVGWEEEFESLQAESEPHDPADVKGNFTHQEIGELVCGSSSCSGYKLPIMVGQANDYVGYVVSYREYSAYDDYRDALTAFGPHTADYINTRLVRMAADLQGGPTVGDAMTSAPTSELDDLLQQAKTLAVAAGGTGGTAVYEAAIPDDGGTAGRVITQPSTTERFDAATFSWEGGSNWTDNPSVTVERLTPDGWSTVATQEGGEVVLTLEYESVGPEAALDWLTGGKVYRWTATYEAFEKTEPGSYRFVVAGRHRSGRAATPYNVISDAFDVRPWSGIEVYDFDVDAQAGTARFKVGGVELHEAELETDDDAVVSAGEVHYPDTYASALDYISRSYEMKGQHRYCFRCTFRPWADTGDIAKAKVTVHQSNGVTRRIEAVLQGNTFVADGLDLRSGDTVVVEPGGVTDVHGNRNGAGTAVAGPFPNLDPRIEATRLTYTGPTSVKASKKIALSALLETVGGDPIASQPVVFTFKGQTGTATTDAGGVARLSVRAPKKPGIFQLVVRFAGTDTYAPSEVTVPIKVKK